MKNPFLWRRFSAEPKCFRSGLRPRDYFKEHTTRIPAMLLCVEGSGVYEDERGAKITLSSGQFVSIEPDVKHWVRASEQSNFLLFR